MDEEQRYARAKARVDEIKGFYIHLIVYLIVNLGLFTMNLFTGGGWWFYWGTLGWGIGLAVHGLSVFVFSGRMGAEWEQRKIRELMEKDERP